MTLICKNKFGQAVTLHQGLVHAPATLEPEYASESIRKNWRKTMVHAYDNGGAATAWKSIRAQLPSLDWDELVWGFNWLTDFGLKGADEWNFAREMLTILRDRCTDLGCKTRASLLAL
jgi:hypothetical protein